MGENVVKLGSVKGQEQRRPPVESAWSRLMQPSILAVGRDFVLIVAVELIMIMIIHVLNVYHVC